MRSNLAIATSFSLVFVFAMSCGGGGGDPSSGGLVGFSTGAAQAGTVPSDGTNVAGPTLTAVVITNNPAKNGDSLHVNVSFTDSQGDVANVNVGIAGQATYSTIAVAGIGTQTSGTLFLDLKPSSNSPGTYTLVVSITDLAGHTSAAATQSFTILNPDGTLPGTVALDGSVAAPDLAVAPDAAVAADAALAVDTKTVTADTAAATGYWELVQTDVFDKLAATDTNYGVSVLDGSIVCSWSQNNDVFKFTATWTIPPKQIRVTDKIPINIALKLDQNTGDQYSANGNFDLFFDRPECEPGFVIAPIGLKGALGETGSLAVSHKLGSTPTPPAQVFINGKDLPTGSAGARIALMAIAYNGRSSGIRYIYAWK